MPSDYLNRHFITWNIKSHFRLVKKQRTTSKWHSTTWIIAFTNSSESHFGLVKRQKMSSQCLETTRKVAFLTLAKSHFWLVQRPKISWKWNAGLWNIVFSTSTKSQFGMVKMPKLSKIHIRAFEKSLSSHNPIRILVWSRGRKCVFSA